MKRKINLNRETISSEEIAKKKDFQSVLKQHAAGSLPFYKKAWFAGGMAVTAAAIITTLLLMPKKETVVQQHPSNNSIEQGADSLQLAQLEASEKNAPCIHPPIPGLDVPVSTYTINAKSGGSFHHTSGSLVQFPASAFVDHQGKTVQGKVTIQYREFHDAADFFVSGIPMTYDSAGVRYQFESAGMMEIKAFQDGKPVFMAPGKEVKVELASNYNGDYNLYKLDTVKNNWTCLGKDRVKVGPTATPAKMDSVSQNILAKKAEFHEKIEVPQAQLELKKNNQLAQLPVIQEPQKPAAAKKGRYTFNLDVDPKEFPELEVYKGLLFEVGDENTNFSRSMYDVSWDAAVIKEGPKKGENYVLELEKASKKTNLIVYPVLEGKNLEAAQKIYQEKFASYSGKLAKRKVEEEAIEAEYAQKMAKIKAMQDELERKWKEREQDHFNQMSTEEKVMRVFTVNSFGVFNCDNPAVYPKGKKCVAALRSEAKAKLLVYESYLVDKGRNCLFTYVRNPVTNFSFNPTSGNILWTVDNGVLYYLQAEDFAKINSSEGEQDLFLHKANKFNSLEELKSFFQL